MNTQLSFLREVKPTHFPNRTSGGDKLVGILSYLTVDTINWDEITAVIQEEGFETEGTFGGHPEALGGTTLWQHEDIEPLNKGRNIIDTYFCDLVESIFGDSWIFTAGRMGNTYSLKITRRF